MSGYEAVEPEYYDHDPRPRLGAGAFGVVSDSKETVVAVRDPALYFAALQNRQSNPSHAPFCKESTLKEIALFELRKSLEARVEQLEQLEEQDKVAARPQLDEMHERFKRLLQTDLSGNWADWVFKPRSPLSGRDLSGLPRNVQLEGGAQQDPEFIAIMEGLKASRAAAFCEFPAVEKVYRTDNPIFSDLIILSEIEPEFAVPVNASALALMPFRKRMLELLYGLKIKVSVTEEGSSARVTMRKFAPWVPTANSASELIRLVDIFQYFHLTHSDVKPSNIMTDPATNQAWLVDLDNLIQQTISGGYSCDTRFYRFREKPTLSFRALHDKALVRAMCRDALESAQAQAQAKKEAEKDSREQ